MNRAGAGIGVAVLVALALGAGYWWGAKNVPAVVDGSGATAAKAERKVLYYRNPMGLPDTSPVPKKAPDGMDYVAVYADEQDEARPAPSKGKILYYRNPMGLPDTSPVPKKDPMGMDYAPVYEGDEPAGKVVKISVDKVQKLGVKTEAVAQRDLTRTVRAVGTLQADERRLFTVAPKFEGWIQKLYVNTTGATVRRGQPLMDVYSPDLITAQQEYLIASRGLQSLRDAPGDVQAGMRELMESALMRLRNWDISGEELQRLQQEGTPRQFLTLRSRANGVVIEKPSIEGKRFMAGDALYQIADLSSIWLIADVFEQDLSLIHPGQTVKIKVDAYPDKSFQGKVTFIYPTVTPETRTAKVRIELANPGGALKPSMYARLELAAGHGGPKALTVPDSAVLDTGTRQLVLIRRGEGAFEPRLIKTGTRADGYVEVLDGVRAGEEVVVSANFLIDAESNIKAALAGLGAPDAGTAKPAKSTDNTPAASRDASNAAASRPKPIADKAAAPAHPGH
jgi:Cu(I)/Ag(I) efflux system membrane fusion protein